MEDRLALLDEGLDALSEVLRAEDHASRDALQSSMIKSFADKRTQELFATGTAKRFPAEVARRGNWSTWILRRGSTT